MARTGSERTERQIQLGDRIRKRRKKLGLSQEAMANEAGFARAYWAQIEQGRRNVSFDNLADVAAALGVDIGTLVKGLQDLRGHRT